MGDVPMQSDVFIQGPTIAKNNFVFEAIFALYYLPENYKLVFTGQPEDQELHARVVALVKSQTLTDRVLFLEDAGQLAPNVPLNLSISPEAIASVVLALARTN